MAKMRLFVTGASGYIGTAVCEKLRAAGHHPVGLARSETSAALLERRGMEVARGDLRDGESLRSAAAACDGAIHLAMDFSPETPQLDRTAVDSILAGLGGSGKPFLYTSGIWVLGNTGDRGGDETSPLHPPDIVAWRPDNERVVLRAKGVRGIVIRPAMVYGRQGGFAAAFRTQALADGVVRFVGDGGNRWPFVHVDDLADLYVLALGAPAGSLYFASVGDSVKVKDVARAAARGGRTESIPLEEARRKMGPMADALVLDQAIASRKAQQELGWQPGRPTVLVELEQA
jgi:nucleoside-diphosphate-sugar epimerase